MIGAKFVDVLRRVCLLALAALLDEVAGILSRSGLCVARNLSAWARMLEGAAQ